MGWLDRFKTKEEGTPTKDAGDSGRKKLLELGYGTAPMPGIVRALGSEWPAGVSWVGVDYKKHPSWRDKRQDSIRQTIQKYFEDLRKRGREIIVHEANAAGVHEKLGEEQGSFDYAYAGNFFSDIYAEKGDLKKAAESALKMLKSGGFLLAIDLANDGPKNSKGTVDVVKGFTRLSEVEARKAFAEHEILERIHLTVQHACPPSLRKPTFENEKIRLYRKV